MQKEDNVIRLNPLDNIAVALKDISKGEVVRMSGFSDEIFAIREIPYGHKIAIVEIDKEQKIIKYGECMGISTKVICIGEHVHVKNVRGLNEEEHLNILHNSYLI